MCCNLVLSETHLHSAVGGLSQWCCACIVVSSANERERGRENLTSCLFFFIRVCQLNHLFFFVFLLIFFFLYLLPAAMKA